MKYKLVMFLGSHRTYIYPTVLVIALLLLSIFKISGTSIGIYHNVLYGQNSKDSNLLLGEPRQIRSDEWLVVTQATIAQKEAGFPQVNKNFNDGMDMSLLADAPYLEWSAFFKPQYFAFFVMPLENAFAFKWWFLLLVLLLSVYFLCLKLVPNRILFAIGTSIVAGFSPFIFWWYQSSTILALAYGTLIALLGICIIDRSRIRFFKKAVPNHYSTVIYTLLLTYTLVAFALLLYPPFQIPVAIVVGFFILGYLLSSKKYKAKKQFALLLLPFACAIIAAGSICVTFVLTRSDVVHTISSTAYPGKRSVPSGGYNLDYLLVNYLQPQLINDTHQTNYYSNQSEVSSFILLPLFFIIPLVYAFIHLYVKKKRIDWVILGLLTSTLLLLAHLFIPPATLLSKLFFLNIVPIERATIGLGFVTILIVIYIAKLLVSDIKITRKLALATIAYSFVFFVLAILSGLHIRELYPDFIASRKLLFLYALIVYAGMTLILLNKMRIGIALLALFSIYSVFQVHPFYQGLGPIYHSKVDAAIREVSTPKDVWGVADDVRFENLPQMSNRKAITGVAFYPDLSFWNKYSGSNDQAIYNRYAHIVLDQKTTQPILLVQKDIFVASPQCSRKLAAQIDFILSTSPVNQPCYALLKTVTYPNQTFYIYKTRH